MVHEHLYSYVLIHTDCDNFSRKVVALRFMLITILKDLECDPIDQFSFVILKRKQRHDKIQCVQFV